MKTIANVRVGKADVSPTLPSHVSGVSQGNALGSINAAEGMQQIAGEFRVTTRRSTGIRPEARAPIDPKSPVLTPA